MGTHGPATRIELSDMKFCNEHCLSKISKRMTNHDLIQVSRHDAHVVCVDE